MKTIKRTLLTIETDPICIRDVMHLKSPKGRPMIEELMEIVVTHLTEAVREFPSTAELKIRFCNILNRETNPDGDIVFFRVFEQDAETKETPCR